MAAAAFVGEVGVSETPAATNDPLNFPKNPLRESRATFYKLSTKSSTISILSSAAVTVAKLTPDRPAQSSV